MTQAHDKSSREPLSAIFVLQDGDVNELIIGCTVGFCWENLIRRKKTSLKRVWINFNIKSIYAEYHGS